MPEAALNLGLSAAVISILLFFVVTSVMESNNTLGVHYRVYSNNKTLSPDHPDYWQLHSVHKRLDPVVDFASEIAKLTQAGYAVRVEEIGISNCTPSATVRFDFKA